MRSRIEFTASYLSPDARDASTFPLGHPEGWVFAIANVYRGLGEAMLARELGEGRESIDRAFELTPGLEDGVAGVRLIDAARRSHEEGGSWITVDGSPANPGA